MTLYQLVHDIFWYGSSTCLILEFCSSLQKDSTNEQIQQLSNFNWRLPQDKVPYVSHINLMLAGIPKRHEHSWHMAGAIIILSVIRYLLSENTLCHYRCQLMHNVSFNYENRANVWCNSLLVLWFLWWRVSPFICITPEHQHIYLKILLLLSSHRRINGFEISFNTILCWFFMKRMVRF